MKDGFYDYSNILERTKLNEILYRNNGIVLKDKIIIPPKEIVGRYYLACWKDAFDMDYFDTCF